MKPEKDNTMFFFYVGVALFLTLLVCLNVLVWFGDKRIHEFENKVEIKLLSGGQRK